MSDISHASNDPEWKEMLSKGGVVSLSVDDIDRLFSTLYGLQAAMFVLNTAGQFLLGGENAKAAESYSEALDSTSRAFETTQELAKQIAVRVTNSNGK
ncbi:MAG: hypothetical protein ACO1OG_09590 [Devosia sp.]